MALDLELVEDSVVDALAVVSLEEMKRHLRIKKNHLDDVITDAIREAVAKLDGRYGELNRSILPKIWRRNLSSFPDRWDGRRRYVREGGIELPFGPVIEVVDVSMRLNGSSVLVPSNRYIVGGDSQMAVLQPVGTWDLLDSAPRAVSVTYIAGFEEFPDLLKRFVKILAAHQIENPEATINEPRQMAINRRVEFGVDDLRTQLRVEHNYEGWD